MTATATISAIWCRCCGRRGEDVAIETLDIPTVPLPTVTFRPTGDTDRTIASKWMGRPQVHSDDDGDSYLVIPCQHMEISIGFGEDTEDMESIIQQLQERITEIKEIQS